MNVVATDRPVFSDEEAQLVRCWHVAASFVEDEETSDAEAGTFEFVDSELIEQVDERRREAAVAQDELEWLHRCDDDGRRVDLRCGEREYLHEQLSQARLEVERVVVEAMTATGKSRAEVMRFAQVQRAIEHGVALREAFNYRATCSSLDWSTYKRIAFKRRYGTFAKANAALAEMLRKRARRALLTGELQPATPKLIATRVRRCYPLGAGGRGMRQAA